MYQNQKRAGSTGSAIGSQVQQSYTIKHDFESAASVTATLTHALSDVSGIDVSEIEYALKDYVDPDALDRLFMPVSDGSARVNGHLAFNLQGYQVTLYGNGLISIVPPQHQGR